MNWKRLDILSSIAATPVITVATKTNAAGIISHLTLNYTSALPENTLTQEQHSCIRLTDVRGFVNRL